MAIPDILVNFLNSLPGLIIPAVFLLFGIFLVCLLLRLFLGKGSGLNQAFSTALGILLIYILSMLIYLFRPTALMKFLAPLPFLHFSGDQAVLVHLSTLAFPQQCREILSMVVLAFLCSAVDERLPRGAHLLNWTLYRALGAALAMLLHYLFHVVLLALTPALAEGYGPMIVLCILVFMVLLGALKLLLSLALLAVSPVIGALHGFFFRHHTGKKLSRAILTTLVMLIFHSVLIRFGYDSIPLSPASLLDYWLVPAVLIPLWYCIDHAL